MWSEKRVLSFDSFQLKFPLGTLCGQKCARQQHAAFILYHATCLLPDRRRNFVCWLAAWHDDIKTCMHLLFWVEYASCSVNFCLQLVVIQTPWTCLIYALHFGASSRASANCKLVSTKLEPLSLRSSSLRCVRSRMFCTQKFLTVVLGWWEPLSSWSSSLLCVRSTLGLSAN